MFIVADLVSLKVYAKWYNGMKVTYTRTKNTICSETSKFNKEKHEITAAILVAILKHLRWTGGHLGDKLS